MQISGLPTFVQQPSPRSESPERAQRQDARQTNDSNRDSQNAAGQVAVTSDALEQRQQQVISPREADRIDLRQLSEGQSEQNSLALQRNQQNNNDLPLNTQRALQTFQDNAPSLEERLGVELVGVDTFA